MHQEPVLGGSVAGSTGSVYVDRLSHRIWTNFVILCNDIYWKLKKLSWMNLEKGQPY